MYRRMAKIIPTTYEYIMKFDGCSKGNPGHSGAGAVIYKNNVEIWSGYKYIGHYKTNNQAEYSGLILGLQSASNQKISDLLVCGDSEMVIKQMNKLYKVKSPNLIPLYEEAKTFEKYFNDIMFMHIYREQNSRADELSNVAVTKLFEYETSKIRN
jgi:ribonuclease HI